MFSDPRATKSYLKSEFKKNKKLDSRLKNLETWEAAAGPRWDDLRTPITSVKLGGVNDPGFAQLVDNGAGSTGVFTYWFDAAAEEEVFLAIQLPHAWYKGTNLKPHVHWTPSVNGGAGQVVSWGLEYTVANDGSVFGNTNILYANTHSPADASLVQNKHYITSLGTIVGTTLDYSAMLICRLFRDAAGVGATDDYPNDAGLLEFDLHLKIISLGSKDEY